EQILKDSEEKYRSIFDQARDGIVLIDMETGSIADCNAEFEKQTGRILKELKNMKIWDLRPPDKRYAAKNKFFEIKREGCGVSSDLEFLKPKGERVHVEFVSRTIKIKDRQYLQSIVRDTTERRMYEEEIRKFKTIFDKANYGSLICDIDGNIININECFALAHGYSINEVTGKNISIFHTPDQFNKVKKLTMKLKKNLEFRAQEVWHLHKKGYSFPMLMNAVSIIGKNGKSKFIASTAIDITELKQAEEEREKLINRLKKALAEITQLSGMLPICASCKKIRDDKGYWHQVESYIRDHAGIEFTHGLCPECAKKYCPDMSSKKV
ncbi:PAS domain S-box protein, partial [bacterium]|nr:PAS domain S-box protein [bacterium]